MYISKNKSKKIFSQKKEEKNKNFKIPFLIIISFLFLFFLWKTKFWGNEPQFEIFTEHTHYDKDVFTLGLQSRFDIEIKPNSTGICSIDIELIQSDTKLNIWKQDNPYRIFPISSESILISIDDEIKKYNSVLQESVLSNLKVKVSDCSLMSSSNEQDFSIIFDFSPPEVSLRGYPYYLNQGGAEFITFTQSEDVVESFIRIGPYQFPSYTDSSFRKPNQRFAWVAFSYELNADTPIEIVARDRVGNEIKISPDSSFFVKSKNFRQRKINIPKKFILTKVKNIIDRTPHLKWTENLKDNFLQVNNRLRLENAQTLFDLSRETIPEFLWKDRFHAQKNMAVMAEYADHRSYFIDGKKVDRQVHLGYDLASVKNDKIRTAAAGKVVFSGYLGIYGNTVVIDHGYGLTTVYAHLSEIKVQNDQNIKSNDIIGLSGVTGLAGGDHLHFSFLIQGIQTDPKEFWDQEWLNQHMVNRLEEFRK